MVRKTQIWRKSHWHLWDFRRIWWDFAKSDQNLTGSTWNKSKSGVFSRDPEKFHLNLEILCRNLGFSLKSRFLSDGLGFSGFGGEGNRNRLARVNFWWRRPTADRRSSWVRRCWIGSGRFLRVGQVFGWVWTTLGSSLVSQFLAQHNRELLCDGMD